MKSEEEILKQIEDLFKKRTIIPDGVRKGEEADWKGYCEGGISALYWVLERQNPMTVRRD